MQWQLRHCPFPVTIGASGRSPQWAIVIFVLPFCLGIPLGRVESILTFCVAMPGGCRSGRAVCGVDAPISVEHKNLVATTRHFTFRPLLNDPQCHGGHVRAFSLRGGHDHRAVHKIPPKYLTPFGPAPQDP